MATKDEDGQAMMAVFNLCYMKHAVDHKKDTKILEDHNLKSDFQIGLSPDAKIKRQKALKIEEHKEATIGVQQRGLYRQNYAPSNLPPIPRLHSLIQICSKPYEKQLTRSDVKDDQARLAMSKEHVINHLIPLLNENEDLYQGIQVITYDLAGKEYPMVFKIWASKIHVLTGGWKTFCHEHDLVEIQDFVRVWIFRNVATGNLCFVIDRVERNAGL